MDVFAAGDTACGVALDARVGGSPFNTAVGLARLAQPVSLLASISRGFLGERLMQGLQAEGVDTLMGTMVSTAGLTHAKTVPIRRADAFDVSMSGAAPVTVTVSCSWPTSSVMSRVTNCWVAIRTPLLSNVRNPVRVALTV